MYNYTGNNSAYLGMELPISGANIDGTGLMLNERVKFTANTGLAIISTANSNLDGSGTIADLITAANYGTLIKRITIKAQGTTTQGMVRIFHRDAGGTTWLMREVEIPAITQSSEDRTLIKVIDEISLAYHIN
ncbi:MAG: hypothetical protein HY738_02960 [Bacteroidia bacterium]|nr:hypothetical protein [Bacteroidia bacterium]